MPTRESLEHDALKDRISEPWSCGPCRMGNDVSKCDKPRFCDAYRQSVQVDLDLSGA